MRKNKNSKRMKHYMGSRADYRTGGRVQMVHGGEHRDDYEELDLTDEQLEAARRAAENYRTGNVPPGGGNSGGGTTVVTPPTDQELADTERRKRILDTGRGVEDIAAGTLPDTLPKNTVSTIDRTNTESEAEQLTKRDGVTASTVAAPTDETVTKATTTTAEAPKDITTSTMTADTVDTNVSIDAAQGEVSEDSLAKAAKVDRVAPIEGADVEIKEGALATKVTGTLSPEAKAVAAQNTGSSLRKLSRAKKQLRNAGLSENQISEIGDDIEALEDRLDDFTEEERGLIAGLDKDTLVDAQMSRLLDGMENGEIPMWASPAVSRVEQMLAARGLSASTVGQVDLTNAIIQAALPMAQSNASALQQAASQQRDIEAKESEANAQRAQQTALSNADKVFGMDMANMQAEQQTVLSNSKFMQTVSLTEASNDQQAAVQNAILTSQANLAEADFYQKSQIQNAQAFLQTDLSNLSNEQQASVVSSQLEQQRLLSNQSATNAAAQFNSASENQTQQFMASLNNQITMFNAQQANNTSQFNAQSENAAEARKANRITDVNKANAAILNQTAQFNEQIDFQREQWNAQNKQAVIQSNVAWRRQSNMADTAATNAVNQQNVQNAFGLTSAAQSFLWQELRDQADYDFRFANDSASRKTQAAIAAAQAEGDAAKNWNTNFNNIANSVSSIFGD